VLAWKSAICCHIAIRLEYIGKCPQSAIGANGTPSAHERVTSKVQGQQTSGASSVSQQAALAPLEGPKVFIRESRVAFQSRRDLMVTLLNDTPGLECVSPAGAF
jgi:aspartate/methionine/tyrosine aminotransferase